MNHTFKENDKIRMAEDCFTIKKGEIAIICTTSGGDLFAETENATCHCQEHWLPVEEEITWETLKVNDQIKDKDGNIRTVLGVCGRVIFVSWDNQPNTYGASHLKEWLIGEGYTIIQPTKPCCDNCVSCIKCNK